MNMCKVLKGKEINTSHRCFLMFVSLYLLYDVWATHPGSAHYGILGWNSAFNPAFGVYSTFAGICTWISRFTRLGFDLVQVITAIIGFLAIYDDKYKNKLSLCALILLLIYFLFFFSNFLWEVDVESIQIALHRRRRLESYRELISIFFVYVSKVIFKKSKACSNKYLIKTSILQWIMIVLCGLQIFYALCSYPGWTSYLGQIEYYEFYSRLDTFSLFMRYVLLFLPEVIRAAMIAASIISIFVAIDKMPIKNTLLFGSIVMGLMICRIVLYDIYDFFGIWSEVLYVFGIPLKMFEFISGMGATIGYMVCGWLHSSMKNDKR